MHLKLAEQSESTKQTRKSRRIQVSVALSHLRFGSVLQIAGEEAHDLPSSDPLTNSHDFVLAL